MPIDRDSLLAKAFAHHYSANGEFIEKLLAEARRAKREEEEVLFSLGREWFRRMAPLASGFVAQLREEQDLKDRKGRDRMRPAP